MSDSVICPECGADMVLRETLKFKHKDGTPRKFFGCLNWPQCTATHGAHPNGRPFGKPGDLETKKARLLAHFSFDPLWKNGNMGRKEAYLWLSEQMGIPFGDCHIGDFTKEQCINAIEICKAVSHD